MQQQQRQDGPAAAEPDGKPVAFASPPASPRLSGDGDGEGETTNERSPLKGSRARRSSSGNNTDAPGGANGGGDRVSSLRLRRSLLDALLPLPGGGGGGVEDGESGPQVTLLPGPWDAGAAPIVDIGAVFGSDPVPDGFARVSATPYGRRADLNAGAGGHYIYLTLRRDATRRRPPVVALALIFPDRQEFVPPTFRWVGVGVRDGVGIDRSVGMEGSYQLLPTP